MYVPSPVMNVTGEAPQTLFARVRDRLPQDPPPLGYGPGRFPPLPFLLKIRSRSVPTPRPRCLPLPPSPRSSSCRRMTPPHAHLYRYQAQAPSAAGGRVCAPWTAECDFETQFEPVAPTVLVDRQCIALKVCKDSEYISTPATTTSDRICTLMSPCRCLPVLGSDDALRAFASPATRCLSGYVARSEAGLTLPTAPFSHAVHPRPCATLTQIITCPADAGAPSSRRHAKAGMRPGFSVRVLCRQRHR